MNTKSRPALEGFQDPISIELAYRRKAYGTKKGTSEIPRKGGGSLPGIKLASPVYAKRKKHLQMAKKSRAINRKK